ncbi:MAG: lysophospholipid acyltransferase family protein [Sphaerochaetaceae bacterium]|nr:lysophospholipid acyltransferase family protein [Spirochaetales bacterium]MDY5499518.1 lysophospholipid acyltransferase family protein [Sphaerochaetaceae bacterium]
MTVLAKLRLCLGAAVLAPLLVSNIVLVFLPYAILCLLGGKRAAVWWRDHWLRFMSNAFFVCLGVSYHTTGKENLPSRDRICYIANHQSLLDLPAIFAAVRHEPGSITKVEIKKVPVINLWCKVLGCVYIDRKSVRSSIKAILDGVANVEKGIPMLIFPEGTRSRTGKVAEFKAGSFKLATRSNAVVVPIAIEGTRTSLESRRKWHTHVYVSIGKPIDTSSMTDEQRKEIHSLVQDEVIAEHDKLVKLHG